MLRGIDVTAVSEGGLSHEVSLAVPFRGRNFNPRLDSRPSASRCAQRFATMMLLGRPRDAAHFGQW